MTEITRKIVATSDLPALYPTNTHDPKFWEALGRAIATYGFLEAVLGKAIFSFTATVEYPDDKIDAAYTKWLPTLERALSDPLGRLICSYDKAVRDNQNATIENLNNLVTDLRKAAELRNVLCHGSWRPPDNDGRSVPFYVNRQNQVFDTAIDISFLKQTQQHVVGLAIAVINTVTHMGWQFPGTNGPGKSIAY